MKTNPLKDMKIMMLAGIALASTLSSQAATVVYTENFDTPVFESADPIQLGGTTPDVTTGQWFSAASQMSSDSGTLDFARDTRSNRFRGAGVWLDTSILALGTVTVTFDVSNYVDPVVDGTSYIQAFTASGVDGTNPVSVDLQLAALPPLFSFSGSVTSSSLGNQTDFTANGTVNHTFTYAGEEEIALIIGNIVPSGDNAARMAIFSVDNVQVAIVPEPSAAALIAGLLGLSFVMLRRR